MFFVNELVWSSLGKGCFVVRCNICSINVQNVSLHMFPMSWYIGLQKCIVHRGIYWSITKQVYCIPYSNSFFYVLHAIETYILLLIVYFLLSFIEVSIDISWSKCVASDIPNLFSISCIQPKHKVLLLRIFGSFYLFPSFIDKFIDALWSQFASHFPNHFSMNCIQL